MWADPGQLPGPVNGSLGLILIPRPFATVGETVRATLPAGGTIAELLAAAVAEGLLDGAVVPWLRVSIGSYLILPADWHRVRPKEGQLLLVSVQATNGGSLRTILSLALIAVATYVGASLGGWVGALAAAAISIGGNLIINALIPPVQPKAPERVQRYSLDGASNAATPHMPVPILLGRRRVYPPRCANYYTVLVGQDVFLRCMFQPSIGWCDRTAVKIGETAIEGYSDVTLNWHTRPDDTATSAFFANTPAEDALALPLTAAAGWTTRATPIEGTRVSLDIGFQSGLYRVDSGGHYNAVTVTIEVRYGPSGGDPEVATPAPVGSISHGSGDPGDPPEITEGVVTFSLDVTDAYRRTLEWDVPLGMYDVHLRRTTADSTNAQTSDKSTWINIRSFHPDPALPLAATTPWVEIEIKASSQLNGVLDTFNFVATSMVHAVTATGLDTPWIASRNPADLFTALSYPPLSTIDLDDDERVFSDLAAWRDLCTAQDWTCDLYETGETSIGELMMRVAAGGRARPSVDFGALTVMVDWVKPAPRQLFAARTVEKFKGSIAYPEEVHGLRMRFANAAKNYGDDSVTVWAPGYTAANATRYDSVELRDMVDVGHVEREAQRIMAERVARPETFVFDQDIEALVVRDGERAWLAHPVALIGQIAGRVAAVVVRTEGSYIRNGVRLDERVTFVHGTTYGLAYRRGAALLISVELVAYTGDTDTVWFAAEPTTLPLAGDLAAFGERLVETLDVIVDRITPKPGLRAEIACVAYAPELQTLDTIPVTSARTALSIPPGAKGALLLDRGDAGREEAIARMLAIIAAIGGLAGDAAATADGKVETFYQATTPAAEGVGDLWFDTGDGNHLRRWSGTAWVSGQDESIGAAITAAAGAQATADGKVTTFYAETAPTAEGVGDLWYRASTKALSRWSGTAWTAASPLDVGDNATANLAGDFANRNGSFEMPANADGSLPGWYLAGYGGTVERLVYPTLAQRGTCFANLGGRDALLGEAFAVTAGEKLWFRAGFVVNHGAAGTIAAGDTVVVVFRLRFFDGSGAELYPAGQDLLDGSYPWGGGVLSATASIAAPTTATTAQLAIFQDFGPSPTLSSVFYDYFECSRTQFGADVTATETSYDTAHVAGVLAVSLVNTAAAAYYAAQDAGNKLSDIANNGVFDPGEKQSVLIPQQARLAASVTALLSAATTVGVTTEATAVTTAQAAYNTFLTAITPNWNNDSVPSPVDRTGWNTVVANLETALATLNEAVAAKAATKAVYTNVSGTPTALVDINPTEGAKLTGIAANATRNVNRGAWTAGTAYVVGDFFTYGGASWSSTAAHTADAAAPPPNANVTLLVDRGATGANGLNSARPLIYHRGATSPALPTATATYTFSTGALSGLNNGWTQAIPATDGTPLWVSAASAVSATDTDTIGAGEWATPVQQSVDGAVGAAAINNATAYLFQRTATASPPAGPAGSFTYTFSIGVLTENTTGALNSWSPSLPTSGGSYRWIINATALATGATDNIGTSEWSTPALLAQDGAPGAPGPAAPPFTGAGTGTTTGPTVFLEAGAAIPWKFQVWASAGGSGGGNCVTQLQVAISGSASWSPVTGGTVTTPNVSTEPIQPDECAPTFTNTTGVSRSFDFRLVSTGFAGRTLTPDQSYLRGA